MRDTSTTLARGRPDRWLRRLALTATAAVSLTLIPVTGTAGAETFIDPTDPCLPDATAPRAPARDYERISPVHRLSVDCVYAQNIARGQTDGTYRPADPTTRGQMATFIVNALRAAGYTLPPARDPGFTDIAGSVHADNIRLLATIGVTSGRTATTYEPNAIVRRDQMASYLVQAAEYAFGEDDNGFMAIEGVPAFVDVPPANVHYDNVNAGARVLGLLAGRTPDVYAPDPAVTREQMASFLVRLVDMTLMVA